MFTTNLEVCSTKNPHQVKLTRNASYNELNDQEKFLRVLHRQSTVISYQVQKTLFFHLYRA